MAKTRKQNLLTGAGILAIATILVKIIGALYKIPLTNLITMEGYAYFTGAYAIYTPLYAISMAGLPVAVSKLVSQNVELKRFKDAKQIFVVSRKLFTVVGLCGMLILAAIAIPYSKLVGSRMNFVSILVIAPCIMFCCQMSSFRGYYEGLNNMIPTGISQVIEAMGKLVIGLVASYISFTYWLNNYHTKFPDGVGRVFGVDVKNEAEALAAMYPYVAAMAVLGVTLGSLFGMIFLYIYHSRVGLGFSNDELLASPEPESKKAVRNQIIKMALPIALSSLVLNLSNMIDDLTIRTRLARALEVGSDVIKQMYQASLTQSNTLDSGIANYLYGTHGSVINIKNLIPTITLTLGISAIPVLSKAWARKDKVETKKDIESVLRVAMIISLPCGFGMTALSEQILRLLYKSQESMLPIGTPMLCVYGIFMFAFASASPISSMLQAIGKPSIPLRSTIIGSVIKIVLNFILIGTPSINIKGAPISTAISYVVIVSLNLFSLLRATKVKINFASVFLRPFIAAAGCGLMAFGANFLLSNKLSLGNTLNTIISICVGGLVYVVLLLLLKGLTRDDLSMLPKGEKIAKLLEKVGLLG